jgi:CheY-like chemotaxis protein
MFPANDAAKSSGSSKDLDNHFLLNDEIDFLGYAENYFICFTDIVNSTNIISGICDSGGIRKYYGIFLNTIAKIARNYGGRVMKNVGDSIIVYFPKTLDASNSDEFQIAMSCCMEMLNAHNSINLLTRIGNLPSIDYRMSADYGKFEIARSRSSKENDLMGQTMNVCVKMNSKAKPQGLVIGGDLYEILNALKFPFRDFYNFQQVGEYSSGLRFKYPIFAVSEKNSRIAILHPAAKDDANNRGGALNKIYRENKNRYRIMIVDDELDIVLTYKSMLEDEELFEVDTFVSSQEALQQLFSTGFIPYDLVITDIRMPPPNGFQLYNIIKSLNNNVQVLFITAYDILEEVASGFPDIKHENVLKKPVSKPDLLRKAKLLCAA